jgi:inosine-uridine nucleoside N-ribohydrolase
MSRIIFSIVILSLLTACRRERPATQTEGKIRVIFDTDANNELDDQHALAYLLFSGDVFAVEGVTVNATRGGGPVEEQAREANRVMQLCGVADKIKLLKGANGTFHNIEPAVDSADFDGKEAVDFIIQRANATSDRPLFVIAVGKLTNVALAVRKDPSIVSRIRLVWLGSNYPEPGEYNQENDTSAVSYLLKTSVPFEMATVRYAMGTGTDDVRVTPDEIRERMPGLGPHIEAGVEGRHGGTFHTFGDYSISLFENIELSGDPPSRALYDMAAVAIVKDPSLAHAVEIPCPALIDGQWRDQPDNSRKITVWENFDRDRIMKDFYETLSNYVLADSI